MRAYSSPEINRPLHITTGPDGALWFTNYGNRTIGRITTSGVVTVFTNADITHPDDIVSGPDGALWFTDNLGTHRSDGSPRPAS